ncbi:triosephosphate isomerase [Sedimentibacter acidaminivorans]|uniref:Triosephosphate isomerase n=1 Tax=Sedimentibacter acidaminivorans TaxID=913099 RepID=A0ABS4GCV5_9FIRM|nr:triose-phosphate isomerase [Sedimentibacter acidaminivorans]MBP1925526.1 triosephosphate isomerase [Sedimentibacter acidaminivorans]
MRIPLIAGNWKMNNNIHESISLVNNLIQLSNDFNNNVEVLVCVPFTALYSIRKLLNSSNIKLGAQNMHYDEKGAYTGEISPLMLKEIGVEYVIVGHSERRQYFNETDESVNKKLKSSINFAIKPILCIGETLEQRERKIEKITVENQIINAFKDIKAEDAVKVVIAYEPIWAIGTGKTATSEEANEMSSFIRNVFKELYNEELAKQVIVLYGGSVKGENASELMNQTDIDGALVGGASLSAEEFIRIINFNQQYEKVNKEIL